MYDTILYCYCFATQISVNNITILLKGLECLDLYFLCINIFHDKVSKKILYKINVWQHVSAILDHHHHQQQHHHHHHNYNYLFIYFSCNGFYCNTAILVKDSDNSDLFLLKFTEIAN